MEEPYFARLQFHKLKKKNALDRAIPTVGMHYTVCSHASWLHFESGRRK